MTDVLILGAAGQLGNAIKRLDAGEHETVYADIAEVDLTDRQAATDFVRDRAPAWIINCAAYTAVDKAESERDLAFAINRDAVENIALAAGSARVVHISTDFVFSGEATEPYQPDDAPDPVNAYGESKLAGEQILRQVLPDASMIIRTAWLYALDGNNFVKTMLRLMAERDELSVVNDQFGSPTYATGLANAIWQLIDQDAFKPGICHWTDDGIISWHDFASAIQEEALNLGLLDKAIPVHPIETEDYPTPAKRPKYSALDSSRLQALSGVGPTHWREHLRQMLEGLRGDSSLRSE